MTKIIGKNFLVLYKDEGDSCDGIPRYLGEYDTREEAQRVIEEDIVSYTEANTDSELTRSIDKGDLVRLECESGDWGCEWYIIKKED